MKTFAQIVDGCAHNVAFGDDVDAPAEPAARLTSLETLVGNIAEKLGVAP